MNETNALHLQLHLINAQIFEPPAATHFIVSISSKGNQYNTSAFELINHQINLKSCSPVSFSRQQNSGSFFKVTIKSCDNAATYQTQIEYRLIEALLRNGKRKQKHILAFPLFGRTHNVAGELKIRLTAISFHQPNQQQIILNQNCRTIYSQGNEDFFQPVYSRMIKVSIYDNTSQQKQYENQEENDGEYDKDKGNLKSDFFEPFKEQISEIQLKQSHEGRLNEQEQREMAFLASSSHPLPQKEYQQENMPDIPQDCQHLFQKINEINRRYAPLERIPSQEEFSDYSQLNQGDYKIGSDVEQEISHPLQEVQQLLKQLDLYKFAQTLHPQEEVNSPPL